MNKKIKFSSLLKNASSLTDIFDFYKKNFPTKKFLFSKIKDTWSGKTFQEVGINIDKIINSLSLEMPLLPFASIFLSQLEV